MELEAAGAPISVSLVKPSAIDTPFPEHAGNHMEREPTLPQPIYAPEVAAEAILHCCEVPTRDIFAGGKAAQHSLQGALMPRWVDFLMEMMFIDRQKSGKAPDHSDDALWQPTTGLRERGDYKGPVRETSAYTEASMLDPLLTWGAVAGAGLLVAGLAATAMDGSKGGNGK